MILKLFGGTPLSTDHALTQFISQASATLEAEYNRIFATTTQDPGTAGDQGEANWKKFLEDWLPSHFHVETKGQIISHNGSLSPQVDIVVLKPSYPKKLLNEKKIWLADGVAAAFECKNTLTAKHIKDAVETSKRIKKLTRRKKETPVNELRSGIFYGILANSHSWKVARSNPLKNVKKAFVSAVEGIERPELLIDVICVADLACWMQQFRVERKFNSQSQDHDVNSVEYSIDTVMARHLYKSNSFSENFKPIGSLITHLTGLLALHDEQSRDLAKCYDNIFTEGSYENDWGHCWSLELLSPSVRQMIPDRSHSSWHVWDGWQREF
jgi:hypothetical protein